jgi:hypothetical protein
MGGLAFVCLLQSLLNSARKPPGRWIGQPERAFGVGQRYEQSPKGQLRQALR